MRFHVATAVGASFASPSPEQMRTILYDLDDADEEHGAAWLSTEDGDVLEWSVDGRLVLSTESAPRSDRHLKGVTRDRALFLWIRLARGDLAAIEQESWLPTTGVEWTPEREQALVEHQHKMDRDFYDVLGDERHDTPCRHDGCVRGAISLSIFCRRHHFEMVQRRTCPFDD